MILEKSNTFHIYYSKLYNIKAQQVNKEGDEKNIEEIRKYILKIRHYLPYLKKQRKS